MILDFSQLPSLPPDRVRYVDFVARLGVTLTAPQLALARVAFDGEEPRDVPRAAEVWGPVQTIPATCRGVVNAVCGARSGKSYAFGALRLLWGALTRDLSSLAPGQQAVALVVAPDMRLAREVLRYVLGAARSEPTIARCIVGENVDRIQIRRPDGHTVAVECLPATRGGSALRGRALTDALLDECAFFRDASAVVNDAELFRAVAPRILPGGQLLALSTPWLSSGMLYETHRENFGHPVTAMAALAPTRLMREGDETIRTMLDRERLRDPENYAREYDAEFMGAAAGAFFDPGAIERAIDPDLVLGELAAPGVMVTFGADFGFRRDSSALVGVHRTGPTSDPLSRYRVAEMHERRPAEGLPLRPSETVAEFSGIVRKQRASYVVADGHYREAIAEHLATAGLGFVDAPTTPADAFVRARELLHEGRCVLPNEPRFLRQLRETVARPQSGGGLSIVLPRWKTGGHGDIVSAWVLAVHHAGGQTTVAAPSTDPHDWAKRMEELDDRRLAGEGQRPWWMKKR